MKSRRIVLAALGLAGLALAPTALAQQGLQALQVTTDADGGQTWSVSLQVLALMTVLSLLPAALIMMTAFTRIIVVLAILRQALGTAQTPSSQVLVGLALFLTFFIMAPVFERIHDEAFQPYMAEEVGFEEAIRLAGRPIHDFMITHTRETDLAVFAGIAGVDAPATAQDVPFSLLMPAFVTSELMSMGMMMLSPLIISFPFKIMLFVLVDGWALVMGTLAASFY